MAVANVIGRQTVNIDSDTNYYFEVAPQGDSQARFVDVTLLTNNGNPYNIPIGSTIILEGKNAGGYNIFISCTQQSANVVRIPLSNGVLSYAGVGKYSVGIYHGGTYVLSFPFNIVVTEAPYDIVSLQASDVYEALNLAIAKAAASNKWIVGSGDPDTSGVIAVDNDYYLDASNGNLWQYLRNASGLDWEKVVDTSNKQMNIMEKTYIRYSPNSNGVPMYDTPYDTSTTPPTARDYIGFFTTIDLPTDSEVSDPSNYSWSPLRIDVSNVVTEYAKSTSYTTHPTTGWSSTIPLITNDDYLWTKIILELKDGNSFSYYTVTQYGKYGDFGTPTSSIEDTPGEPMVTVTVDPTSPSTAKIFDFDFKIRGGHWKTGTDISGSGTQTITTLNKTNTVIGDMYLNTTTNVMYRCTAVTNADSTWEEAHDIRGSIWRFGTDISGSGTQTSTTFTSANTIVSDTYVNSSTGYVYECTAVTLSNSTWRYAYAFSGTVTNVVDLANTVRFYETLNPGDTSLTFHGTDTIFNAADAQGNSYYYHIKFLSTKPSVGSGQNYEVIIGNGTIDVTLPFKKTTIKNMQVTPVAGQNPQSEGWWEADASSATGYSPTTDTSVVADKKYYKPVQICMEVIKKIP